MKRSVTLAQRFEVKPVSSRASADMLDEILRKRRELRELEQAIAELERKWLTQHGFEGAA